MKLTKPSVLLWIVVSIAVIVIIVCYTPFIKWAYDPQLANRALLGDSFGVVNALFSGLAFSGVIITILMQRHELEENRDNLEKTRVEDRKQRFETSVFLLINLHLDIIEKLDFNSTTKRYVFRKYNDTIKSASKQLDAFQVLNKLNSTQIALFSSSTTDADIEARFRPNEGFTSEDVSILIAINADKKTEIIELFHNKDHDPHVAILKESLKKSRKLHHDVLAHYFRNLYNIFKTIDEANFIDSAEKIKFANLVKTQLSNDELVAIFYNSIVEIDEVASGYKALGFPKMTKLISKYNVLEHLGQHDLIHPIHREIFERACIKANQESA